MKDFLYYQPQNLKLKVEVILAEVKVVGWLFSVELRIKQEEKDCSPCEGQDIREWESEKMSFSNAK